MSDSRIGILFSGIVLLFGALAVRLFVLQADEEARARVFLGEGERQVALPAVRGAILDRDGNVLRASVEAFGVMVAAPAFRERNVADALADLFVLLSPEPAGPLDRPSFVARLRGAAARAAIDEVLALDVGPAMRADKDDLHGRARLLVEPEGTLVRPASHARRRVVDALVVIAGASGKPARQVRARVKAGGGTAGFVAGADPDAVLDRMRQEDEWLSAIGSELGIGSASDVRTALDDLCDRHFRRVEIEVENRVNDAICAQHFGSWNLDLGRLDGDDLAALRARAAAAFARDQAVRDAVASARKAAAPERDRERIALRAALCEEIRRAPDFKRARYMDARKEAQTRNELATFRDDVLGNGGGPAVLDAIERPGALSDLGFAATPDFRRDPKRAAEGESLALLLGEVNARSMPLGGGVEQRLDATLRGEAGSARVRADGTVRDIVPPRHGSPVRLTLSTALQERLENLLGQMGAIAVVDVKTGGVLATTTWPRPRDGDARSAFHELRELQERRKELRARLSSGDAAADPLLCAVRERITATPAIHRGVTSVSNVPPGSVMKALTLLVGLEKGVISSGFEVDCTVGERAQFGCHHHGRIDLEGAIERSCNEYCYQTVGLLGGAGPLVAAFDAVGLFDEVPGMIGASDGAWMRDAIGSDDPRNLAIGQGSLSLPPVRLAGVAASLAAGRVVRPHLAATDGFAALGGPFARAENLATIRAGMRRVVTGPEGTARASRRALEPLAVAGKTGTAQLRAGDDETNTAWFVGYAPFHEPRYAFAVMLERTPQEGADAAPIAAKVVDACYDVLGGRP